MPEFMPISLRIGPLTIAMVAKDVVELERPGHPAGQRGQDDRQVLGPGARHDGVDRDLLDGELPELAEGGRAHAPHDLVARAARAGQHRLDALLGREDDRQEVGPALLDEQALEALLGIGRPAAPAPSG